MNTNTDIESIAKTILALSLEHKKELLKILEQQIFELEEANYEDNEQTIKEIESVKKEYEKGEYLTLNEYLKQRNEQTQ
jgi:hypothetical protein